MWFYFALNDHLPQKQGLRLLLSSALTRHFSLLNDHLPQKQGLRH